MGQKIRSGDQVVVITGADRGKVGRVLRVLKDDHRVVVEGVRRVKRHQKPVGEQPGSIVEKELSVHWSNVALWNAEEGRKVKVAFAAVDGKKVRTDRKTGKQVDG